jgi:CRISPR-associated endoribonuclease Cas6
MSGGAELRLLIRLESRADAAYDKTYHNKLRGVIWHALEGSRLDEEHDSGEPLGIAYSNPFPPNDMREGDERTLLIASVHEDLLAHIAESLKSDREMNIGEMPFQVKDMSALDIDVGEPGTEGVIETGTGVVVRLYEKHRKEYGIETGEDHGDTATYWRPEMSLEVFRNAINDNLQYKHDLFAPDYLPGPNETNGDLFESYEMIKTYALPLEVTTGEKIDVILSKWRFDYEVQDEDHRRHLNLALDTGIGGRNGYGMGFCNILN